MTDLTQWFSPEIDPVYVGWWQRDYGDDNPKATAQPDWWDGQQFMAAFEGEVTPCCAVTGLPWRGLADKPTKTENGGAA